MRLLDLEAATKELLDSGKLNMGHARALLMLKEMVQVEAANKVVSRQMSVRDTEKLVKTILEEQAGSVKQKAQPVKAVEVTKLEQSLSEKLGAGVAIQYNNRGKGKLVIEYNNLDELDGILQHIQ